MISLPLPTLFSTGAQASSGPSGPARHCVRGPFLFGLWIGHLLPLCHSFHTALATWEGRHRPVTGRPALATWLLLGTSMDLGFFSIWVFQWVCCHYRSCGFSYSRRYLWGMVPLSSQAQLVRAGHVAALDTRWASACHRTAVASLGRLPCIWRWLPNCFPKTAHTRKVARSRHTRRQSRDRPRSKGLAVDLSGT